jgi:hypothetical protein
MRRTIQTLGLSLIFCIGSSLQFVSAQKAIKSCVERKTAAPIGYWMWRQDAQVSVYVRTSDFKDQEVASILKAIKLWDEASAGNGSGVRFIYVGASSSTKTDDNSLTIMRGATTRKEHRAEIQAFSKRSDQIIDYAAITIDPSVAGADATSNALAHEIGHSLGLLDCYSCKQESTAMWKLSSSGVKAPTGCDNKQVKEAYVQLKLFVRPAPASEAQTAVDEGEEPIEDDTPIVDSKPSGGN